MNTSAELTIVIPAKNEARSLPRLLSCLANQDYPGLRHTKVYVADAHSTDGTREAALACREWLDVEVIDGGLPSVGRNAGARQATTKWVLFIDADIEICDRTLLRRTVEAAERLRLYCATTNIRCSGGGALDHLLYAANNIVQRVASWTKPFATGMYMLFDREAFGSLGGFDEEALYAEDYLLTQKVRPRRFRIISGHVLTSNRRFRKMGHLKIARMFVNTAIHTFDRSYFHRDQNYWTDFTPEISPTAGNLEQGTSA